MEAVKNIKNVAGRKWLANRLFIYLFKLDISKLETAESIYKAAMDHFNIHASICPLCKSKGHSSFHDEYDHQLTDYYGNELRDGSVKIRMASCSCGNTYSILPDIFVPHISYSILFIMLVLRAYFVRTESVESLCARFGISVSTFYNWKKRYRTHKSLHIDKIEKYFFKRDPHLTEAINICLTEFLCDFYSRFGFSFLQYSKTAQSSSP